jgi:predicted membrane protein
MIKGEKDRKKWRTHLYLVLFTNQTITNNIIGYILFYLIYNREAILLVKGWFLTWRILD